MNKPSVTPGGGLVATGTGCDPGAAVTLSILGQTVGTTTADASGAFSANLQTASLAVGRYTLTAECGPTLTTTVDVVLPTQVPQGASDSLVLILLLVVSLSYFLFNVTHDRRV